MNQNVKQLIYGAILLGGGLYLGRMIGIAQTYKETGDAVVFSYFKTASTNLNSHIALLNLMHEQGCQKASEKLEALVDIDLIALSEYKPGLPLREDVFSSIKRAKQYREKYPVAGGSPEVANPAKKAFDLVK